MGSDEGKRSMRVGIITLHRVRNYGSVLQTLALQYKIEKRNLETVIIDYYPKRYSSKGLLHRLKYKSKKLEHNIVLLTIARAIILVSYVKKKMVFDPFLKKELHMTARTYYSEDELEKNIPEADLYCTGADQVWNSHWNEGIDWPFYLKFLSDKSPRFSYGSSFGNDRISMQEVDEIKPFLEKYTYLSAREDTGKKILNEMGFTHAEQVLDPTLLLNAREWKTYVSHKYRNQKYVVTYNLHHDPEIDLFASKLAEKKNLKVFHISYNLHDVVRKGTLKWCPTVQEYLGLIQDAEYVVTDSFHASVFSILFHKKFLAIYPVVAGARIESLLKLVGLEERGVHGAVGIEIIDTEIDYSAIDLVLDENREISEQYLDRALGSLVKSQKMEKVTSERLYADKTKCSGCGACKSICPKKAISMECDENGFMYPLINLELCINCGLCEKVCAFRHIEEQSKPLKVFAAVSYDEKCRMTSASGGVFAVLAQQMLTCGGTVYGAAFDKDMRVSHIGIHDIEDLVRLQGSKYVQSDTGKTFMEVQEILNNGGKVLYAGTPCQIAGLQSFLGNVYENLTTVDIICHGVPSYLMFSGFLKSLENKFGSFSEFRFRDKRIGWGLNGSILLSNGRLKKIYGSEYAYYYYFLNADIYRDSCYQCKYAGENRPGDITLGDFWGIEKAHPEILGKSIWKEENGISTIICNTEKGEKYIESCKEGMKMYPSVFSKAAAKNPQLQHPSILTERRKIILSYFAEYGYEGIEERYHKRMKGRVYKDRIKSMIPIGLKRRLKKLMK